MSPACTSRAAKFSRERLLAPPNLLRRAAVAETVGVGRPVLKPVPLVELAEEAEGATEGVALPTCSASWEACHTVCIVLYPKLLATCYGSIGQQMLKGDRALQAR